MTTSSTASPGSDDSAGAPEPGAGSSPASFASRLGTNLLLALAVAAVLVVRLGLVHSLRISSINMVPTLSPDDHVVVRSYGDDPGRGDVVVYRSPFGDDELLVGRIVAMAGERVEMNDKGLHLDGRPVATSPAACGPSGTDGGDGTQADAERAGDADFDPDHEALDGSGEIDAPADHAGEPAACTSMYAMVAAERLGGHRYLTRPTVGFSSLQFPERLVPAGHVFVLNDNRIDERDSRIYGTIPLAAVVGVAAFVYYAYDETGIRWDRMSRRVS